MGNPRSNRIKEFIFNQTINGASTETFFSENVNGELLSVEFRANRTGSIALTTSGAAEEMFRRNAPSGTGTQITHPAVFTQNEVTGSIANASHTPFIINGPVALDTTGYASGTQTLNVTLKYR